ncbi:hypothetical protein [Halogeometricum borinquense]|uniref:hypothetical protein n=1 Tax=Halogeometricum borinquense TaxID=60847 RepID=UPI003424828C
MIGYPTLVLGTVAAYLRGSKETRPFVRGAFGIGVLGECGALSGVVQFTQSAGSAVVSMLSHLVGAVA